MKEQLSSLSQKMTEAEDRLDDLTKESTEIRYGYGDKLDKIEKSYATQETVDQKIQAVLEKMKREDIDAQWK